VGVAAIAVFGVLLVGALTAAVPIRWVPASAFAFVVGFPCGELAGQLLIVTVAAMAALDALGWPGGVLGDVALAAACVATVAYVALLAVGLRARVTVRRALASARGLPSRPQPGRPQWLAWWRTCLGWPVRGGVRLVRDLPYVDDEDRAHRLDVILPAAPVTNAPVVLFAHGGAWVFGSKKRQGLPMLFELAARGWVCVTCDYRLSPRATWPDHVVDVKRALAWTRAHAADFGGDPDRFLAVAGNSAGGHLAALCALSPNDPEFQPGFEDVDTSVDACVSLYGVLEMTGDAELAGGHGRALASLLKRTVVKASVHTARETYESASPIHRIAERAPAFLVLHGTHDTLVPVEVARAFVDTFARATTSPLGYVELPWAQHAFDLLCSPRCTATTEGICEFLESLVATRAVRPAGGVEGSPRR
jgi:acetyl esterase/lipase